VFQTSFADYLDVNLIRIFVTKFFTHDVLHRILSRHPLISATWATDAMRLQKYKNYLYFATDLQKR